MESSYHKIADMLSAELKIDDSDYDKDTDAKLRKLRGLLAGVGVLTLHLQGRVIVKKRQTPTKNLQR